MNQYPQNHLYNPNFKYVPAAHTDIRMTFERIKKDQDRTIEVIREFTIETIEYKGN